MFTARTPTTSSCKRAAYPPWRPARERATSSNAWPTRQSPLEQRLRSRVKSLKSRLGGSHEDDNARRLIARVDLGDRDRVRAAVPVQSSGRDQRSLASQFEGRRGQRENLCRHG